MHMELLKQRMALCLTRQKSNNPVDNTVKWWLTRQRKRRGVFRHNQRCWEFIFMMEKLNFYSNSYDWLYMCRRKRITQSGLIHNNHSWCSKSHVTSLTCQHHFNWWGSQAFQLFTFAKIIIFIFGTSSIIRSAVVFEDFKMWFSTVWNTLYTPIIKIPIDLAVLPLHCWGIRQKKSSTLNLQRNTDALRTDDFKGAVRGGVTFCHLR